MLSPNSAEYCRIRRCPLPDSCSNFYQPPRSSCSRLAVSVAAAWAAPFYKHSVVWLSSLKKASCYSQKVWLMHTQGPIDTVYQTPPQHESKGKSKKAWPTSLAHLHQLQRVPAHQRRVGHLLDLQQTPGIGIYLLRSFCEPEY